MAREDWVKIDLIPLADLVFPDEAYPAADSPGDEPLLPVVESKPELEMQAVEQSAAPPDRAAAPAALIAPENSPTLPDAKVDLPLQPQLQPQLQPESELKPDKRQLAENVLRAGEKPGISPKTRLLALGLLGLLVVAAYGYWLFALESPSPSLAPANHPAVAMETTPVASETQPNLPDNTVSAATERSDNSLQSAETVNQASAPAVLNDTVPKSVAENEKQSEGLAKSMAEIKPKPLAAPPATTESFIIEAAEPIEIRVHQQRPEASHYLTQAYELVQQQDYLGADRFYRQVLALSPNNVDALLGRGVVAEQLGDQASAEKHYQQVLALDNANVYAANGLVRLKHSQFPVEKASDYQALAAQFPEAAQTHADLGNLYAEQQRWAEAQQAYFEAVSKAPENADYQYNLAVCLDHLGKASIARRYYQQALQLAKNGPVSFTPASVYLRLQQLTGP